MLKLPFLGVHCWGSVMRCPGVAGLTLPFDWNHCRPLCLQLCSSYYQLPSRSFSTTTDFIFFFKVPLPSPLFRFLTFRKIFLFLCHTEINSVYLTKQLNVTIKAYLIMMPLFECAGQHLLGSALPVLPPALRSGSAA